MWSVSEWVERLTELGDKPELEVFKFILSNIDGYAVEYGIDDEADAQDLLNAFVAWKMIPY
jgi:hypothetical protein